MKISIIGKRSRLRTALSIATLAFSLFAVIPLHAAAKQAKGSGKARAPAATPIIWRGGHYSAHIFKDLAAHYTASGQGKVLVQPFSTVSGLDAVHGGTADVAGSGRSAMPGRNEEMETTFYPVAWDALVPIVSIDNPVNNISLKNLHDLYLGHVTNWSQLGGEDAPINLYAVAAPLDGIEYSTRQLLFYYGDQSVSAPRLYINTVQLEAGVVIDPHGIGMSTLSDVADNHKLKMLSVEGVVATDASVTDGTYPLYSTLYLASRSDGPNHAAVSRFIAYTSSDAAKKILRKHHLVPYSDAPGLIGTQDAHVAAINAIVRPPSTVDPLKRIAQAPELPLPVRMRAVRIKAENDAAKKQAEKPKPATAPESDKP